MNEFNKKVVEGNGINAYLSNGQYLSFERSENVKNNARYGKPTYLIMTIPKTNDVIFRICKANDYTLVSKDKTPRISHSGYTRDNIFKVMDNFNVPFTENGKVFITHQDEWNIYILLNTAHNFMINIDIFNHPRAKGQIDDAFTNDAINYEFTNSGKLNPVLLNVIKHFNQKEGNEYKYYNTGDYQMNIIPGKLSTPVHPLIAHRTREFKYIPKVSDTDITHLNILPTVVNILVLAAIRCRKIDHCINMNITQGAICNLLNDLEDVNIDKLISEEPKIMNNYMREGDEAIKYVRRVLNMIMSLRRQKKGIKDIRDVISVIC